MKIKLLVALLYLCCIPAYTQTKDKELLARKLNEYFFLERENIYVQLSKDIFFTNENIWFKGYVYHRKKDAPFFTTVNVFASLINEKGENIETQLLYSNKGTFSGSFELSDKQQSGKYYIQFYTNWMNNFTEDESAVYEVDIVNLNSGVPSYISNKGPKNIVISVTPESGILLEDTQNTMGIKVLDPYGIPTEATYAEIIDINGRTLKTVSINKNGYGKFIVEGKAQPLKAVVTIHGKIYEQQLPVWQKQGLAIKADSFTTPGTTTIKVHTNAQTLSQYRGSEFYLLIHQDDKASAVQFKFDGTTTAYVASVDNSSLSTGLNTVRLLDDRYKQIAERNIYIYPDELPSLQLYAAGSTNETHNVAGTTSGDMNLSVSILPSSTKSIRKRDDIFGALLFKPYLQDNIKLIAAPYIAKDCAQDLDLVLLHSQSKYKWENIMNNPPKCTHDFDIGLKLKGTINQPLKPIKDYNMKVLSKLNYLNEILNINDRNEFVLDNLILNDAAELSLSLLKKGKEQKDVKLYPQILNADRKFNKAYKPGNSIYNEVKGIEASSLPSPKFSPGTIVLEEVQVEQKRKPVVLKYAKFGGNNLLKGYKLTETDNRNWPTILDLIRYHGFEVRNRADSSIAIWGKMVRTTFWGQKTKPVLYIDNMIQPGFDILRDLRTEDVDEFFIDRNMIVPSMDNRTGVIKIYLKKYFADKPSSLKPYIFKVPKGFKEQVPFKNAEYAAFDEGFENFGLIDWQPYLITDSKGNFNLKIPKIYKGEVKVLIEGFNPDGKMISETKTIVVK